MTILELVHELIDYIDEYGSNTPVLFNDEKEIKSVTSKFDYSITAAEYPRIVISDKEED